MRRSSALALALGVLSSTCCDGTSGGPDAGLDASHDSGRDASRPDAFAPDAPRDVGTDVGRDAPFPGDPEFVPLPLPGVTDAVDQVLRARHPERYPVAGWSPCLASVPSCRQQNLIAARARVHRVFATDEGLWAYMLAVGASGDVYDGIGPVDGPLAGIWRRPLRDAASGGVSFGASWHIATGGTAAFSVNHRHDGLYDERLYVAALHEIGSTEAPRYVIDMRARGRGVQRLWVNDDYLLAEIQPDISLYMWRLGQETFQVLNGSAIPGIPQNEVMIGGHVMWEAWASVDETRLVTGGWDRNDTVFRDIDPDDLKALATDGTDMAWLQLYDRNLETLEYARMELWTMPYAGEPDASSARLVDGAFPERNTASVVGGGWFGVLLEFEPARNRVELHPLHGGATRWFRPPDGANITGLLFLDGRNLFVSSGPNVYWVDPRELPEL